MNVRAQVSSKYDQTPVISCTGFFNNDLKKDQFELFSPTENSRFSRCILDINGKKYIFDELLPSVFVAKKVIDPFVINFFRKDTLSLTFSSSEFGHNEFYIEKFTLVFDERQHFFYLATYEIETCLLPDGDQKATLVISMEDLKNPKAPFSYSTWEISPSMLLITKQNRQKFESYTEKLKEFGIYFDDELLNSPIRL